MYVCVYSYIFVKIYEAMDVSINYIGGVLSKCMLTSNNHDVYFKDLTILFVTYLNKAQKITSSTAKKENNNN